MERGRRLSWGALLVLWGLVAVGVGVPQLFVPGLNKALWISWVLLWSGVLLLGMVGVALPIRSPELNWWIGELKARGLRWEDYYASADPVPNGPVPENDPGPPPYPISEPVHNRASLWRDHTTYWQNRDEFVTAVVRAVSRHDEALGGTLPGHEDLFDHAVKRRAWRVQALALGRTIAWLSGAAVIFRHWPAWSSALVWGGRRAAAPLAALFGRDVAQRPFPGGEMALAAGTLAVVFVAYLIAARLWRDWSEEEVEAFFRRAKSELPPIAFVVGLGLQGAVAGVLVIPGVRAELWGLWMVIIAVVFSLWFAWREPRAKRAQPQAPTKTRSSRPRT